MDKSICTRIITASIISFCCLCGNLIGQIRLPSIIADDMVLQSNSKVSLWGWADAGEKIQITSSWTAKPICTSADKNGKWKIRLKTPQDRGPFTIIFKGPQNTITLRNVMCGEVWVCSGQSNMEMPLGGWLPNAPVLNSEKEIQGANFPNIRLFTVSRIAAGEPQEDCKGKWVQCSSASVVDFSAAGYFFARRLHQTLNTPVGIINASWGGTFAESWTCRDILLSDPDFGNIFQWYADAIRQCPELQLEYDKKVQHWQEECERAKLLGLPKPSKPIGPYDPNHRNYPSGLYNAMIAPLMNFTIRGVIWYQGESNCRKADNYQKLFIAMIKSWRDKWNIGDFPFYYVQITSCPRIPPNSGTIIREAQLNTLTVPHTGMVVTTDISDINNVHPADKLSVGERLATLALAKTYGFKNMVYSGPIYTSNRVEGPRIRIFFDHVGSGLIARNDKLTEFAVAGPDRVFIDANAVIEGNTVVVRCPAVKNPQAVRFGWSDTSCPNLFNKEGFPASPFRTDKWQLLELQKE